MNRRTLFSVIGGLFAGAALPKVVSAGRVSAAVKRYSDEQVLRLCCDNKDVRHVGDAILRLHREGVGISPLRRMTELMVLRVDMAFTDGWSELLSENLSEQAATRIATMLGFNELQRKATLEVCGNFLRGERYRYYAGSKTEAQKACHDLELRIGFKAIPNAGVRLSLSKEQVRELVAQELENLLATKKAEYTRLNDQLTRRYTENIVG